MVNNCKGNAFVLTTVSQNKGNMIYCCCFLNAVTKLASTCEFSTHHIGE